MGTLCCCWLTCVWYLRDSMRKECCKISRPLAAYISVGSARVSVRRHSSVVFFDSFLPMTRSPCWNFCIFKAQNAANSNYSYSSFAGG